MWKVDGTLLQSSQEHSYNEYQSRNSAITLEVSEEEPPATFENESEVYTVYSSRQVKRSAGH